jgi:hypothetical protein
MSQLTCDLWHDRKHLLFKDQPLMPVVLKIDPHRRVVHSAFYGKITDAELLGHRTRIASDPDFNPQFADIVDFSDVTDPAITESAISALAANPTLFSSSAVHIVIAPAAVMFQLGAKFKELAQSSRPNFYVVKTRAEAYQILSGGNNPKPSPR